MNRIRRPALIIALVLAVIALPAGGCTKTDNEPVTAAASSTAAKTTAATSTAVKTTTTPAPKYPGLNLSLTRGTWWQYIYNGGAFQITLGDTVNIGGVEAYKINITGDAGGLAPRWKYLAAKNCQLLGSVDGQSLQVIYDGQKGTWDGGGFFTTFPNSDKMGLSETTLSKTANWGLFPDNTQAYVTGKSKNDPSNTVIEGYEFHQDTSYSSSESEYYLNGVGPIGYSFYESSYVSGGTFDLGASSSNSLELRLLATSLKATGSATIVAQSPWVWKTTLPGPGIRRFAMAVADSKIYVTGGYVSKDDLNIEPCDSVYIFDTATNKWTNGPPMPWRIYNHISEAVGGKIYVMGGTAIDSPTPPAMITEGYILQFDPATNKWDAIPARAIGTRFKYDAYSTAYRNGIMLSNGNPNDIAFFNAETGLWYVINAPPVDQKVYTLAAIGNTLYAIGGEYYDTYRRKWFSNTACYATNTIGNWTHMAPMAVDRNRPRAMAVGGNIYVFGAAKDKANANKVEMYNPATDTWTFKSNLPPLFYADCGKAVYNKIYVFMGTALFEYDPARDK